MPRRGLPPDIQNGKCSRGVGGASHKYDGGIGKLVLIDNKSFQILSMALLLVKSN